MHYEERQPPPSLRRHLRCLWRLRADGGAAPPETIYPDGCCELIVHLEAPPRRFTLDGGWQPQARCLFAAQLRSGIRLAADRAIDCIGLRLQPAASALLAGASIAGLVDQVIDLHRIDPAFATALEAAATTHADAGDATPLWTVMATRTARWSPDVLVERAVERIDAVDGQLSIATLARSLDVGVRSLQLRFRRAVGLGAKEYARIRRLQASVRQLDDEIVALSALSLDRGFADQAHATRELQRLTGLTPARLRRALRAERSGDTTLRLAAAFVRGRGPQTPATEVDGAASERPPRAAGP